MTVTYWFKKNTQFNYVIFFYHIQNAAALISYRLVFWKSLVSRRGKSSQILDNIKTLSLQPEKAMPTQRTSFTPSGTSSSKIYH